MTPALRVVLVIATLCGMTGAAYLAGPPPAHTGGFGEPTCVECHFDGTPNEPGGSLRIHGIPETFAPGKDYAIDVVLARPGLARGGFELAARFADGPGAGTQAGRFTWSSDVLAVDSLHGVHYLHHRPTGRTVHDADSISWKATWLAPDEAGSNVVFHVAANAANGDDSEFGDFIYTEEVVTGSP